MCWRPINTIDLPQIPIYHGGGPHIWPITISREAKNVTWATEYVAIRHEGWIVSRNDFNWVRQLRHW